MREIWRLPRVRPRFWHREKTDIAFKLAERALADDFKGPKAASAEETLKSNFQPATAIALELTVDASAWVLVSERASTRIPVRIMNLFII